MGSNSSKQAAWYRAQSDNLWSFSYGAYENLYIGFLFFFQVNLLKELFHFLFLLQVSLGMNFRKLWLPDWFAGIPSSSVTSCSQWRYELFIFYS